MPFSISILANIWNETHIRTFRSLVNFYERAPFLLDIVHIRFNESYTCVKDFGLQIKPERLYYEDSSVFGVSV